MYDVIVIGARCAGSPTAMLLARQGYRVLLVDKATFPSDIMSSHFIHLPGVASLKHWGVLDNVIASNCPPIPKITFDLGPFALVGMPPPIEDVTAFYAPRRTILDKILVDAATVAGVELREGFFVEQILMDGDSVTGIQGHDSGGRSVKEHARIVIGADGMRSLVARTVQAPTYHRKPVMTCAYYGYWSDVPLEGAEIYIRPRRMFITFPTNENRACIYVACPHPEFHTFRADIEGNFLKTIDLAPQFAERVSHGKLKGRFAGTAELPNFFRKPYGPGWALVGDAGYHKDPFLGLGITDAFRDAEIVAEAIDSGFSGRSCLEEALDDYERQRNEKALPIYEFNAQQASMEPPPPEMQQLFAALQGNQEQTNRFFGIAEGTTAISDFFSPENIQLIMAGSSSLPLSTENQDRTGAKAIPCTMLPESLFKERRLTMYVAIRRMKAKPGLLDEAIRRIENGFMPLISHMPGFVQYVGMQVGEDEGLTISFFETQEQAEESTRRAAEWVKQNLAPLASGPHEVLALGEVRFHKAK